MEPVWEYRWEYVEDGQKRLTHWMTVEQARMWHGYAWEGTRRLDETRRERCRAEGAGVVVDWRTVHSRSASTSQPPPLPQFDPPTYDELRRFWVLYRDRRVRRVILEVQEQRQSLRELLELVQRCFDQATPEQREEWRRRRMPLWKLRRRILELLKREGRF